MCGRFAIVSPVQELINYFGATGDIDFQARYNIAPGQAVPVLPNKKSKIFELFRWGLLPPWSKDPAQGSRLINARAESAHEKASFKQPLREQRCIVPADGFYEWKQAGKIKQPLLFRRRDKAPMALAGLWSVWQNLSTFTILTCAANGLVAPVHDRMPVVLGSEHREKWLSPKPMEPAESRDMLVPCPDDWLDLREVNPALNSVRNEGPALWQVPQASLF